MQLTRGDATAIHEFLAWVRYNKTDAMTEQQKEFFTNLGYAWDNQHNTYCALISICCMSSIGDGQSLMELPFQIAMDIASIKRQYFGEYHRIKWAERDNPFKDK